MIRREVFKLGLLSPFISIFKTNDKITQIFNEIDGALCAELNKKTYGLISTLDYNGGLVFEHSIDSYYDKMTKKCVSTRKTNVTHFYTWFDFQKLLDKFMVVYEDKEKTTKTAMDIGASYDLPYKLNESDINKILKMFMVKYSKKERSS